VTTSKDMSLVVNINLKMMTKKQWRRSTIESLENNL
jgi:hypothetical protein